MAAEVPTGGVPASALEQLGLAFDQATIGMAMVAEPPDGSGSFAVERSCRRGDGQLVDLVIMVSPLHDTSGQLLGYFGQVEDITARNEASRALRASEARLRSVIANAPIVLSGFDRDR